MQKINVNKILKECNHTPGIIASAIFTLIGIGVSLYPILGEAESMEARIFAFVIDFCVFGISFGWFMGLRILITQVRELCFLKKGNVWAYKDTVIDKRKQRKRGVVLDLITTKEYSDVMKKGIYISVKEGNKINEGDEVYLLFTPASKKAFELYPVSKYELQGIELRDSLTI